MKRMISLAFIMGVVLGTSSVVFVGCNDETATTPGDTTVASLQSKTWSLVFYGTPGSETGMLSGTSITATFSAGQVSGGGGCNSYSASCNADDTGNLSVGAITSTMMYCFPAERMTQETAFENALKNATAYQIVGGILEIMYGSGQHLLFE
jgi:heat shock protein HslJ